ncbi:GerW family sporulation protein [Clostridium peptidivorans]|uniref:GerW family sporulation protein n=1 Tax=Clostridium peptidivorans TaxID=100174 RepID=UPI000BE44231|nr:GerW family sporulation protein [Clostridium peptidivorans]
MENHPIDNLMKTTMENIKSMIDVNTIVGDAVETKDGSLIIPISRVSFGFACGGSELEKCEPKVRENSKYPFGGGSGAGVSVKPVAFLVAKGTSLRMLSISPDNPYDKVLDNIPHIIELLKGFRKNSDTEDDVNIGKSEDDKSDTF